MARSPEEEGRMSRQQSAPYLREKARRLLEQGLTRRQIARRLRRKESTVTSWLTGLGGEVRKPWTDDDTRAVLTMRAAGCRWKDICFAIGRREETIRTAFRRRGIAIPPKPRVEPLLPPPPPKRAKKKNEPFERPCRPVTWKDWHEQRERERASQAPPPPPPPQIADDWEDKPIGLQKTNSPALERRA